jgi:hypothetical protein
MNNDTTQDAPSEARPDESPVDAAPNGFFFPLKRLWWFFEKHFLWPVADSFRAIKRAVSYRSPLAYIGATAMICVTAGAVAAAVYFYDQANTADPAPVVAEAPLGSETVIAPVSPPATTAAPAAQPAGDETLNGVVPQFPNRSGSNSGSTGQDGQSGSDSGSSGTGLPATVVRPSPAPKGGPLKVAHGFAESFVGFEIGERKATRELADNATKKLARELRSDPPRLPSNGQVPKATVMNVVAGKKKGDRMEISVSLMRSGATSELRLALKRTDGKWLVSEVRG